MRWNAGSVLEVLKRTGSGRITVTVAGSGTFLAGQVWLRRPRHLKQPLPQSGSYQFVAVHPPTRYTRRPSSKCHIGCHSAVTDEATLFLILFQAKPKAAYVA